MDTYEAWLERQIRMTQQAIDRNIHLLGQQGADLINQKYEIEKRTLRRALNQYRRTTADRKNPS